MVDGSRAWGIALLSGSGGVGRTTLAVSLAEHLARSGARILLFDLCFGWGGLSTDRTNLPTYENLLDTDDINKVIIHCERGFDLVSCAPPAVLEPGPDDLKKITWLACKAGSDYDCIVFDPPSGSHPLSLLAAGMCERTLLLARHDTISIAASHRLLDTLDSDGLSQRVGIVFAMVESPGQAASLKARFDAATYNFLGIRVGDTGFIPRLEPALVGNLSIDKPVEDAGELITHLKMDHIAPFHDATKFGASIAGFRVSTKVRR